MIDINCLLAHLQRATRLETKFQDGASSLILNPDHFIVQTTSWLLEPDQTLFSPIKGAKRPSGSATVHNCQDRSACHYSPMILTSTRFRRRPSNSVKDPVPCAKVEAALGHSDDHLAAHHAQL